MSALVVLCERRHGLAHAMSDRVSADPHHLVKGRWEMVTGDGDQAVERQVIGRAGRVHRFRHAEIQDYLKLPDRQGARR